MTSMTEMTTNTVDLMSQQTTSPRAKRPAYSPRGIGALAAVCGGLFGGRARTEAMEVIRLSRVRPTTDDRQQPAAA